MARYNAEFGVDELQQLNTTMRRSRTYIITIGVVANDKDEHKKDELTEQDKDYLTKTMNIVTEQMEDNHVNVDGLASALAMSTS